MPTQVNFDSLDGLHTFPRLLFHHARVRPNAPAFAPVGDAANNWVQVIKRADGGFTAEVGRESFDVAIRLDLADGKILSATMDNPVDVVRRQCADAALSQCGDPLRYRIHRHVELKLIEAR